MSTDEKPELKPSEDIQPQTGEPRSRITMKQTYDLVTLCRTIPSQTHETFTDLAEHVSEQLGFRVTTYSLKMGLEAAERDCEAILKPAAKPTDPESLAARVSNLESRITKICEWGEGAQRKIELLEGIWNKIATPSDN